MGGSGRALALGAALLATALCAQDAGAAARKPAVIAVDMLKFGPAPAGLHVGDRVRWVNRDIFQHSATAANGAFNVELPPGGSGETVLKRAGVIAYSCRYHPGMKGELKVAP